MDKKALQCPKCGLLNIAKNGSVANGKKKFSCKDCSRQFVENKERKQAADAKWRTAGRLLFEKIYMAGIARAIHISKRWLKTYVKKKLDEVKRETFQMTKNGKIFVELMRC